MNKVNIINYIVNDMKKETKMKVENIESNKGNKIANQFIITDDIGNKYFQ